MPASATVLHQTAQPGGSVAAGGVEQTGPLKKAALGLVVEAVFEIAVVVLIRLGVDDDAVVELCLGDELFVVVEIGRRRLISSRGRVGETRLVLSEKVYVGVDEYAFRSRHDSAHCIVAGRRLRSAGAGLRRSGEVSQSTDLEPLPDVKRL